MRALQTSVAYIRPKLFSSIGFVSVVELAHASESEI